MSPASLKQQLSQGDRQCGCRIGPQAIGQSHDPSFCRTHPAGAGNAAEAEQSDLGHSGKVGQSNLACGQYKISSIWQKG